MVIKYYLSYDLNEKIMCISCLDMLMKTRDSYKIERKDDGGIIIELKVDHTAEEAVRKIDQRQRICSVVSGKINAGIFFDIHWGTCRSFP